MFGFLARHRGLLIGAVLTLLALGMAATGGGGWSRSVGLLTAPVQALVRGVVDGATDIADRYVFLVGEHREAERLRREVAELRRELLAVREIQLENDRLKSLLEFRQDTDLPLLPARVVARSASPWFRNLVLDKGAEEGVQVDSPVLTPAGVVGRVYQVSPSASRVLLLTDANSAVDALVQRTRTQVLVEGQLEATCAALYIARGEEVVSGDHVVTSGLGGVFPKGLPLGRLADVEAPLGEVFQRAKLIPSTDFSRLEEVFVVLAAGETAGEPP